MRASWNVAAEGWKNEIVWLRGRAVTKRLLANIIADERSTKRLLAYAEELEAVANELQVTVPSPKNSD